MKTTIKCPKCQIILSKDKNIVEQFRQAIQLDLQSDYALQLKEKEKIIADLRKQFIAINTKLNSGSQQLQGEIQELAIEELLSEFESDIVEAVPKGVNGADCLLRVKVGQAEIGTILIESKRTKSFSEGWINKLKADNLSAQCDLMVIITSAMPAVATGKYCLVDGVWVCCNEPEAIRQLILFLRFGLLKMYQVVAAHEIGKTDAELIYKYLTSEEFKAQFEDLLHSYQELENSLKEEQKRLTALWKVREIQLKNVLSQNLQIYGSLRGRSSEIPSITALEFRQAN